MPNFYWVGGSTGTTGSYTVLSETSDYTGTSNFTWLRAFDWNNPLNWRVQTGYINGNYQYGIPSRCPSGRDGFGDAAIFGEVNQNSSSTGGTGASGSSQPPNSLIRAVAPCLWGGASAAGTTVSWIGGGTAAATLTGTTFTAYISELAIKRYGLARTTGTSTYDFFYIGGGLQGSTWGGGAGTSGATSNPGSLYDASNRGFTLNSSIWGGASWVDLVNAFLGSTYSNERYNQLRVKALAVNAGDGSNDPSQGPGSSLPIQENHGVVSLTLLPYYAQIGSGVTAMTYVNTQANLFGYAHYKFKNSRINSIKRYGVSNGFSGGLVPTAGVSWLYGRPRPHLTLEGCTVGVVALPPSTFGKANIGTWTFNKDCQIGKLEANITNSSFLIELDGTGFRRDSVLADLGISGSTNPSGSGIADQNILVKNYASVMPPPQFQSIMSSNFTRHGVYIGRQDNTGSPSSPSYGVTASWVTVDSGTESNLALGKGITVAFIAAFSANQFDSKGAILFAQNGIPQSSATTWVKINLLNMDWGSQLDFSRTPNFNNWEFGYQQNNQIVGGIVGQDENSVVRGSVGVRLFNEQIISQLRIGSGVRTGAKSSQVAVASEEYI